MSFSLGDGLGQWIFAGLVSVGLHVLVLSLLVGMHGCEGPKPAAEKTEGETAAAEQAAPAPAAEPAAAGEKNPENAGKVAKDVPPAKSGQKPPQHKPSKPNRPGKVAKPAPQKEETWEDIVDTKAPRQAEPASEARAESEPAKKPQEAAGDVIVYEVKRGDNLTRIAREHGCTPEELAKLNGKDLKAMNVLLLGAKIKVYNRK